MRADVVLLEVPRADRHNIVAEREQNRRPDEALQRNSIDGLAIVEGLDLSEPPPGEYQLICLPLRLAGLDGAPARAVLVAE